MLGSVGERRERRSQAKRSKGVHYRRDEGVSGKLRVMGKRQQATSNKQQAATSNKQTDNQGRLGW